jgi:microcystin-dependent protein
MRTQFLDTITVAESGTGVLQALTGVSVTVYDSGASTKPSIYTSKDAVAPIPGSTFITIDGIVDFWVDPGSYDVVFEDTIAPARIESGWTKQFNAVPAGNNTLPGNWVEDASLAEAKIAQLLGDSFAAALMQRLYAPGDLKVSYQPADHAGWLLADGRLNLVRTTYPNLSALMIAQGFNGVDGTHFGIPDYQGRSIVGKGTHADVNALTKNDGIASVASRKPKHQHTSSLSATSSGSGHQHRVQGRLASGAGNAVAGAYVTQYDDGYNSISGFTDTDGTHAHGVSGSVGDTGGPTDVVPFQVANIFIKI